MTTSRQFGDSEGEFGPWEPHPKPCPKIIPISGQPCGHPVEVRVWESHDGAYEDYQYRCDGGGHVWWVDGDDG